MVLPLCILLAGCNSSQHQATLDPEWIRAQVALHQQQAAVAAAPDPEWLAAQAAWAADHAEKSKKQAALEVIIAKRDTGTKLTANDVATLADADRAYQEATIAAQNQEIDIARQQAEFQAELQAQQQQKVAACTVASDVVALAIRNFWGGLLAGLATGIACMN